MQFNQYRASAVTLSPSSSIKEVYIPLWVYSNNSASDNNTNATAAGSPSSFLGKGYTGTYSYNAAQAALHKLNSNWNPSQKFALEVSFSVSNTAYSANVALWDITSNVIISNSQMATGSGTMTLMRSGSFTLTPNHTYGVTIWSNQSASINTLLSKAHLVALLS